MRPLLLGECPSYSGRRYYGFPLSGAIGQRLCTWAGIPPDSDGSRFGRFYWALREHFDCANTIERYEDATPWDKELAKQRVKEIFAEDDYRVVVALGRRAFEALHTGVPGDWFKWYLVDDRWVTVIPHPSGRNLLYNDEENRERASRTLRNAIKRALE